MFHVLQVLIPTKRMFTFTYRSFDYKYKKKYVGTCRSDILIKLKTEFNAIGSGKWE
jgi:hypothetical protein